MHVLVISERAEDVVVLTRLAHEPDRIERAEDAAGALECAWRAACDCVVADATLPALDGMRSLRRLRADGATVPFVVISAQDDARERGAWLDAGADDVVSRPYDASEFAARVRAVIRRSSQYAPCTLRAGDLALDRATFSLSNGGKSERLERKEFQIMELLMRHHDRCVPLARLIGSVWGHERPTDPSVVWTNVSYLRRRMAAVGSTARIVAHRGQGYTLVTRER